MKKLSLLITLVFALCILATPAQAGGKFKKKESWVCGNFPVFCDKVSNFKKKKYKNKIKKKYKKSYSKNVKAVPEIDAAGAAIALAFLAGAIGIRREMKARRA